MIKLPDLPYAKNALAPHISTETIEFHYGKHHKGYVDNLNKLIKDTKYEGMDLEKIVEKSSGPIFNNAAQIMNHTFYWESMTPGLDDEASIMEHVEEIVRDEYETLTKFKNTFAQRANKYFSNGWIWMCVNASNKRLTIKTTHDAGTLFADDTFTPLLVVDLWEHAWYIDWPANRASYLKEVWNILNWNNFVKNYDAATKK